MKYVFFYDETEHSRKINYKTVTANNYYDNFITGIVGWKADENECISDKYLIFESKYAYRKKDGELKSQTMKTKDFRLGFASLNNHTIEFYEDLVSLFDEKIIIYFSVFSKIEYVISWLFVNCYDSMFTNVDYMKYSIINTINVYQPQDVSRYPLNIDGEYHFYIENYGNEVVDLERFVEIFKKMDYNLSCIAGYYEDMAMVVPDCD